MVQFAFRHLTFPFVRHLIAIPEPWKTEALFVDCGRCTCKEKGGVVLCAKGKCTNGGNTFGDQHGSLFAISPRDARLTSKHWINQLPLLFINVRANEPTLLEERGEFPHTGKLAA